MAFFGKQSQYKVQEQVKFPNPHIRFRRIRGRIVPIINRHRVGKSFHKSGDASIKAGLGVAVAGYGISGARKIGRNIKFGKKVTASTIVSGTAKKISSFTSSSLNSLGKFAQSPKAIDIGSPFKSSPGAAKVKTAFGKGLPSTKSSRAGLAVGRGIGKSLKFGHKSAKAILRNPGKSSAALLLGGVALKLIGAELQSQSELGADI